MNLRGTLIILFILTSFGAIGVFRRILMGVDIEKTYLFILMAISAVLALIIYVLKKKQESNND